MTVTVLVDTIRAGTGGIASVLDLTAATAAAGHEVHLAVIRYDPHFTRNARRLVHPPDGGRVTVHYAPGYAARLEGSAGMLAAVRECRTLGREPFRRTARRVVERLAPLAKAARFRPLDAVLARSAVVVKAASMTGRQLAALRQATAARIVQNHAGSPDAYRRFWLTVRHRPPGSEPTADLYAAFCLAFDRILFQSAAHAEECAALDPRLRSRVVTVPPTCDERAVDAARRDPSPYRANEHAVVNIGTIQPRKDQQASVAAFARVAGRHPAATLHLIGGIVDAPYAEQVEASAARQGLAGRVVFHRHRDDYLRYLAHATVLLQTSEAEGVSRVLREAMYAKVPIVSFAIDGTKDVLSHPSEALLASPGDVATLAGFLAGLLEDADGRTRIGALARARYDRDFSVPVYAGRVSAFIDSLSPVTAGGGHPAR